MSKIKAAEPVNAAARAVLEEVKKIREEADHKLKGKVAELKEKIVAIDKRIEELETSKGELVHAIGEITGKMVEPKGERKNWGEIIGRIERWMLTKPHIKFSAAELVEHFPELEGFPISVKLKPSKIIKTEGQGRAMTYFAEKNN